MEKKQAKSIQVMIIDNDKYVRESLRTFLGNEPIKILIFKSASEGLNSLKYQDIDVVIADYFLPDMDGLKFLEQVAAGNPGIARILMATIVNDELKKEISLAGIDALIEKPLSIAAIDHILRRINDSFSITAGQETDNERG